MLFPDSFNPLWQLQETGLKSDYVRYYESAFALGNGYLGTRGSYEEKVCNRTPATLVAGVFDKAPDEVTELANVANWLDLDIAIDGIPVHLEENAILHHERILDLQSGVLYRKSLLRLTASRQIEIVSRRFVSVADVHLMGMEYAFTVIDTKPTKAVLHVRSGCDGSVTNEGIVHFSIAGHGPLGEHGVFIHQKALFSDHNVVMGNQTRLYKEGRLLAAHCEAKIEDQCVFAELHTKIESNTQYRIEKIVAIYTSRESSDPVKAVKQKIRHCSTTSFTALFDSHKQEWAKRWDNSDIEIQGDSLAQVAIRFSIFHLLQASSETDDRVSIPAKALTGFGYKGHVFWDTELFMLPYLNVTNPVLSRNMLTYRYYTLDEARKKAAKNGYRGALFAWESADTGEETTPQFVKHLKEDKIIRIWCGDIEQHINSDVAYAVWAYVTATGDVDFLLKYGAEIILETARFWSSRVEFNSKSDRYEIKGVIGPDEYHEHVNNNYFTNAMAQWNIRKGIELYYRLKKEHGADCRRIAKKMKLREAELAEWDGIADKMFINFDAEKNIFVQFDGFMELDDIDLKKYKKRTQPMDVVLGAERVSKSKISKQADVVMMFGLFRNEFSQDVKKANWEFYEPLCGHGSSLSPALHSMIASDLGLTEKAYEYFVKAAGIDLKDKMGNTEHGLHAATAGGILQAAIYGFAGIHITDNGITVNPRLPRQWESMKFNIRYKGQLVCITIKQ